MTPDVSSRYLGMVLRNPIVVSACPLTGELDLLRSLEELGAAAVVMPSLFQEQVDHAHVCTEPHGIVPMVEQPAHYHLLKEYNRGPELYLKHIGAARKVLAIPVIGSLNITGPGNACQYARKIQDAGAHALELNLFFLPTDPETTSSEVEERYVEAVAAVCQCVSIPVAAKLSPYFTALPNMATRLVGAGASGLVLFNRFLQPDIDLEQMRVAPRLALSTPDELRNTLRWIGLLRGRVPCSLAASGGAHFADDAIKLLLAGADVVMVASTLYRHGITALKTMVDGVCYWLEMSDYPTLESMKGVLSPRRCGDASAFERANYTRALSTFLSHANEV